MTSTVAGASGRKMPPGTAALQLPQGLNPTSQFVHIRRVLKQPNRRDSGCSRLKTLRRVRHADSANRQHSNPELAANFPQSLHSERCAELHLRRRLKDGTENNVVRPFVSRCARLRQAMARRPDHKTRQLSFSRSSLSPAKPQLRAQATIRAQDELHPRQQPRQHPVDRSRSLAFAVLPQPPQSRASIPQAASRSNPSPESESNPPQPRSASRIRAISLATARNLRLRTSGIRTKPVTIGDIAKNPRLSGARQWPSPAAGTSPQPGWHPPIPARKSPRADTDSKGRESIQESGSGSNSSPSSQTRAPTRVVTRVPATGVAG